MIKPTTEEILQNTKSFFRSFHVKYPEFYEYIMENGIGKNKAEKLYNYVYDNDRIPECPYPPCPKSPNFESFNKGYRKYCSAKCSSLDHYDPEKNPAKSKEARQKISLSRQGLRPKPKPKKLKDLQQFVTEYSNTYSSALKNQHPDVYEKINNSHHLGETFAEKTYNTIHNTTPHKCPRCNNPCKFLSVFTGYSEHCGHSCNTLKHIKRIKEMVKAKWLPKRIANFAHIAVPLYTMNDYRDVFEPMPYRCVKCFSKFEDILDAGTDPRCPKCYPKVSHTSLAEKEVINFIIDNCGVEVEENVRHVIKPWEIDIWIPSLRIGVEYHGMYWHSSEFCTRNYHQDKWKEANKHDVHLIQIFESEWLHEKELVQQRLLHKISPPISKIGARDCDIRTVSKKECDNLLSHHHMQGTTTNETFRCGLFHDEVLVAVMTFGKRVFSQHMELIRYCCLPAYTIVGGAERLFSFFRKNNPEVDTVISYCDNRWNRGHMYGRLGFEKIKLTRPNYFWFDPETKKMENRWLFHRLKIEKKEGETEDLIMASRGWLKIHDCGNTKFQWNRSF